ncbi:hypothetical protein EC991_003508 [Linnemannia zychae]|nr:hypothetical protein EC991_003508 [Linnemannia zychae]
MHKSIVLLLALAIYANVALAATYRIDFWNNDKSRSASMGFNEGRSCACMKNTQTGTIKGVNGGLIRLFRSTDCTGDYDILGSNSQLNNANWVNSISFGQAGIPSDHLWYGCPNMWAK